MSVPMDEEKAKRSRRTYRIVEDFAEKWDKHEHNLKENADDVEIEDPASSYGHPKSVANLTARYVSDFFKLRDSVDEWIRYSENYPGNYGETNYREVSKQFHESVDQFQGVIQQIHSHNLLDEENTIQKLKGKNAELEEKVVQLSRDLKKCRDEYDTYKRTVKPLGGKRNPEYGDVVHG